MTRIVEKGGATTKALGKGVFEACILKEGPNLSGTRVYPADVLRTYGPTVFRAGRPSFANHPSDTELSEGRDVTKIMGRLVSDAEYREGDGLYARIKTRPEWTEFVDEYKDTIGLSIFASGDGTTDEQGRLIVESFDDDPYTSVDFVVAAGAGGKVERMVESFKAQEALQSTRQEELSDLVRKTYASDDRWAWVRDYDDDALMVYFDVDSETYSQSYTIENDVVVSLDGQREPVKAITTYVPVKENASMTPEEKAELVASITAAITEALKPAAPVEDEKDAAQVAEAVVAADLPAPARARVFEALSKDPQAKVDEVIAAEKTYVESLKTEVIETPGRIREAGTTESTNYAVAGWSH